MNTLADAVLCGDRRAVARLLTIVENNPTQARAALSALYPYTGRAHVIGLTGASGTGKSTLANQIALELRRRGRTVAIIAVDPSSPFSGGAILGDRIRMQEAASDAGVFIRSMATRGSLGGLARAAVDAIRILDAFGRDVILVETIGVGQDEVDIIRLAHTVIVLQIPTLGDDIQTLKAGILEIGDILVINKADLPGADKVRVALSMMLDWGARQDGWRPAIIQTVATKGIGIAAVVDACDDHLKYLHKSDLWAIRQSVRIREELLTILREELTRRTLAALPAGMLADLVQRIAQHELDPYTAASLIMNREAQS